MSLVLAIDPGNIKSGYVLAEYGAEDITRVIKAGKVDNAEMMKIIAESAERKNVDFAIEMIAGMGMAVGKEVFDTCVWVGRFWQLALEFGFERMEYIYRKEEKLNLCGQARAKDANIRVALSDRYAGGHPNFGKGTKKQPGFFFGFSADMWAAMAVAATYYDKHIKGVKL